MVLAGMGDSSVLGTMSARGTAKGSSPEISRGIQIMKIKSVRATPVGVPVTRIAAYSKRMITHFANTIRAERQRLIAVDEPAPRLGARQAVRIRCPNGSWMP